MSRQPVCTEVSAEKSPTKASGKIAGFRWHYPLSADILLACGLLLAVYAFVTGMFSINAAEQARLYMKQGHFQRAIALLRNNPIPPAFNLYIGQTDELLSEAYFLSAMTKISNGQLHQGMSDLQAIKSGTRFFSMAREILSGDQKPGQRS